MSVTVDRYTTSKFILKDENAVEHIKMLVDLLQDESNLSMGYVFKEEYYAKLISYGNNTYKFQADGYADSGPELRYSAVYGSSEDEEDEDGDIYYDPISIFDEIQKNIKEETWFFVENHSVEKTYFSSYITFYHQDGRTLGKSSYDHLNQKF